MGAREDEHLTGEYTVDVAHSRLEFAARHAMVTKVRGQFDEFEGHAYIDFDDPSKCKAEVAIQAISVDTRNEQRDGHLRTSDFLDVPNHPQITYQSTGVEEVGDSIYRVTGDLTIRGVTNPVVIDFEFTGAAKDPYGNQRLGFEGTTTINRRDWGVEWKAPLETGGVLVSEKVSLEIEVSAVQIVPGT